MKTFSPLWLIALWLFAATGTVYGQNGSQPANNLREQLSKSEQKIQTIVVEDSDNRIEERRVGGQTERITVQPKTAAPAYEVLPSRQGPRPGPDNQSSKDSGGQRVWRVLNF
jgi:hypothetical protein